MSATSTCFHLLPELLANCMEAIMYSILEYFQTLFTAALRSHKHPNWEGEGVVEQGLADFARYCAKVNGTSKGEA